MKQEKRMMGVDANERGLIDLEWRIARILRGGVIVAGLLMLVGWVGHISWNGDAFAPYHDYVTVPLTSALSASVQDKRWGTLLAYSGLFVLISLPMWRVLMTAVLFIKQKEFVLAGIAGFVLAALITSFYLGFDIL